MGFLVKFGPWTIYHSGDTVFYHNMGKRFAGHRLDMMLLPINGDLPERRVAGNLNGQQAAWFAKQHAARVVIPMHYEMFEFNTAAPDEFIASCDTQEQPFRVLKCGERWSSSELAA